MILHILLFFCWCNVLLPVEPSDKKQIVVIRDISNRQNRTLLTLVERLNRLDNEVFKAEFLKLDRRNKLHYLLKLTINQYQQFLQRFNGENEWTDFWQQLSPIEREHIPPTLERQIKMLRNCYYEVSPKPFHLPYLGTTKATPATDLAAWKIAYYEKSNGHISFNPFSKEILLKHGFKRKRLKMLKIPC